MINDIYIGEGNLAQFKQAYENVATTLNKGRMWSQCYPAGRLVGENGEKNNYEWVIGFETFEGNAIILPMGQSLPPQPVAPAQQQAVVPNIVPVAQQPAFKANL